MLFPLSHVPIDHGFPKCCTPIRTTMQYANDELNGCVNSSESHSTSSRDETHYLNNAYYMLVTDAMDLDRIIDSDSLQYLQPRNLEY